jgi:hypothetical protein
LVVVVVDVWGSSIYIEKALQTAERTKKKTTHLIAKQSA